MHSGQVIRLASALFAIWLIGLPSRPNRSTKRFTVADDIRLTHFGDPYTGKAAPVTFSPDGKYFVVDTERGLLEENRPESTLRVFRMEDVHHFLLDVETTPEPSPIWVLSKSTYKDGPIISRIRWLADSTGLAFLTKAPTGNDQLFLADLNTNTVRILTPESQHVTAFAIRDASNLVYTTLSPAIQQRADYETHAASIVGTGRNLYSLIFPNAMHSEMEAFDRSELWAVVDGKRFAVVDKSSGHPFTIYSTGQQALTLAPDGRSAVTALAFPTINPAWKTLYPGIMVGRQDIEAFSGFHYVSRYVLINLLTQDVKEPTNAPIADDVNVAWSSDGQRVVLSNTFLPPNPGSGDQLPTRPCIAVFDLPNKTSTCLEPLRGQIKGGIDQDSYDITSVRFATNDSARVIVNYSILPNGSAQATTYVRAIDGTWRAGSTDAAGVEREKPIDISIRQGLNNPPVLVASDPATRVSRIIWDPNPELRDIDLGQASSYSWKDKTGRDFIGGLYKPPDYVQGQRYPLVIQTHGFRKDEFRPSGLFPSAFAARELAGAGIMVLQVNDVADCRIHLSTTEEGQCVVADYEAAVKQVVKDNLVDADRVGIIGFSRTSYYVMQALTASSLRLKAASISDGVNAGYFQYLTEIDLSHGAFADDIDRVIGASPFGEGLHQWLRRSPEFRLDNVTTPLQVVALNRASVLLLWEPYAVLRALNRPVDLIVVPEGTHVLSNPAGRMISQQGNVDWFCFWLKGEEDPDPAKSEQYARWRALRKLQDKNKAAGDKSLAPMN